MIRRLFLSGLCFVPFVGGAQGLSETNRLVRLMLRSALVSTRIDTGSDRVLARPSFKRTQEAFFAPDAYWSEDDKRAAFDWYLRHLSSTAIERGVVAGRQWIDNPLACAAVAQCEVMSYTNALPILIENIGKSFDQSRLSSIRIAISWSPVDSNLTDLVERIVTNEVEYSMYERNLTYCQFCARLREFATGQNGDVDPIVDDAVRLMYSRRNDPAGAVAIDKTLVALRPGYSNSVDRYSCAISLLTDERIPVECKYYFGNVTNDIGSVLQ